MISKNVNSPIEVGKSVPLIKTLMVYLVICGIGIVVLLLSFDGLIRNHDKQLTGDICGLVTEKMNYSISYMTNSAENMAAVLSAENHSDLQSLYDTLSRDKNGTGYVSIGIIDENQKIG